jgi:hypothetical protein
MTERVYWHWFAMRTDEKKDLAVVVVECTNDKWVALECEIDSDPMSMKEAEALAVRKNLEATRRGEHIACRERSTPQDAVTSELFEFRIRVDALEQRVEKLAQGERWRHNETP